MRGLCCGQQKNRQWNCSRANFNIMLLKDAFSFFQTGRKCRMMKLNNAHFGPWRPREQFHSRLWQERHDWLRVQPWRKRLVCSIIGCDTAWKLLHSVSSFLCHAFQQVNWVVPPVSLLYGQWVYLLKGIICQSRTCVACHSLSGLQHFTKYNVLSLFGCFSVLFQAAVVSVLFCTVWNSVSLLFKLAWVV